jgi:hypothetical protein
MKSTKKVQADNRPASVIKNKVHQLIAEIEGQFQKEGRIKRDFATAALAGALRFLEEISETNEIPAPKKIELLAKVYEAANKQIGKIAKAQPNMPPNVPQWARRDRSQWRMSPCDFVRLNYPTYGKGLTSHQIEDKKLLQALWNFKSRYGWPDDFDLPGRSAAVDREILKLSPDFDLKGLSDAPPHVRRERQRIWQSRHNRLKK